MAHIRHLLTEWPAGADAGILTNLKDQIQAAIDHAALAKNSSTLDSVKQHIHHVINIIEGEGGVNFDGSFGNPGDGIGVLAHVQDRKHASFAANATPGDPVIALHSKLVESHGENAENWSILARDQALSVLDLDSLVGAQTLAGAVGHILQDARDGIDATGQGGADQAYIEAQLMATYTLQQPLFSVVNSTDDVTDGRCDPTHCSLREAINAANAFSGKDTISFDIPGAGPHTIQPLSALPTIVDPVTIDGYTQPGSSPNTNPRPGPQHDAEDRVGRELSWNQHGRHPHHRREQHGPGTGDPPVRRVGDPH